MSELILVLLVALVANLVAWQVEAMRPGQIIIETGKDWVEATENG